MKYRTSWNLELFYKNERDPQIEKDMQAIEAAYLKFAKKYKGKDFTSTPKKLSSALEEYGYLLKNFIPKPVWYFQRYKDIANNNSYVVARASQFEQRHNEASNHILFFELEIAKIPPAKQAIYLKDPGLKFFSYFLKKIFVQAQFNLSESEEQVFALLSQPGNNMWYDAQQKLLSEQKIIYRGKSISFSEATETMGTLPKKQRYMLYKSIVAVRKATSFLATAELNAIYNFKKISDTRRKYKNPYSQTVQQYENEEQEVEQLTQTITKAFTISKKFYKIHTALLGEKKITIPDLYLPIGKIKKKFDFDTSVAIVRNAFGRFDKKYADLLEKYLINGQIDVYPRNGKRGGAYSEGLATLPVLMLLNHSEKLESVETLAHEVGHSIHTELSKPLDPFYGEYTISVAEVASTFFEQFVTEELLQTLPDGQQLTLMHQRIGRDVVTIFRQITCFNCENELHEQIRAKGQLSTTEMVKIMQKHLRAYLGDAVQVTEDDGYVFTTWPHLRYSFYVYTYAYGQLISKALYKMWEKDHSFKTKIEQFLSAGSSMSPKDIFASIGIKTDKVFFEAGLKAIENDVKALEKLAKKLGKI